MRRAGRLGGGGARTVRWLRCALLLLFASTVAAASLPARAADPSDAAVLRRLTRLRAAFLKRIDEEGYALCPAPQIELGDPPTFGRYLPERNVVLIGSWSHLSVPERQAFEEVAQTLGARLRRRQYSRTARTAGCSCMNSGTGGRRAGT